MTRIRAALCLAAAAAAVSAMAQQSMPARGTHGIAATGEPRATAAAMRAFAAGGNAIDAAVAAGLMLGVVDGYNSGIGGGCFLLIRLANGTVIAIDGREEAPGAATREMFIRNGQADPELSQTGPLAVAVPGALAAYDLVVRQFGQIPLRAPLLDAAVVAEQGFPISAGYASRLAAVAEDLKRHEGSGGIFFKDNGEPKTAGEMLVQRDLAGTYRNVAAQGIAWFYTGEFAQTTGRWMEANGGILRAADFGKYRVRTRTPVVSSYRAYQIYGFPPPSSGGVHVAQILNILERFDLARLGQNSAESVHLIAEAMKLAFADRAHWLGDPAFVPVPRGLIAKAYAAQLAARIRPDAVVNVPGYSTPPAAAADLFERHTTHFSTADVLGNWVACTATINTTFGSKVVIPGTGVVLNNEMDDFSAQPGATNFFGLVGGEANSIAPGKRPLSSMSPTLVMLDGRPLLAVGAAGGPAIISQTILNIVGHVDFGLPVDQMLAQPRFHHQWRPNTLRMERRMPGAVVDALRLRGHAVELADGIGISQAVSLNIEIDRFEGAADPRGRGAASGFER